MSVSTFSTASTSYTDRSSVKTFALPHQCFKKGAACTWTSSNNFTVYPRSQKSSGNVSPNVENKLLKIRPEVILFTPIIRRLVNESNGIFLTLQKIATESLSADNQVEYLKISRQYRSVIRVCIETLQEAAKDAKDGSEKSTLQSYITIFYSIECIWHLCEILYIDNIPGDVILPHLLEWVRFHFPCHEQIASEILEACEKGSEENPKYWDTVVGMIVQGRVDVARALLKLHTLSESNEFRLVDNSLRSMPIYSVYGGISSGEFLLTWRHWQAECSSKLTSRILAGQPYLELVMRLLIGEYAAFDSIQEKYSSWFDLLGGWVMFTNPSARRHELAVACASMPGAGLLRTELDVLVRALADGDLHQVMHGIQNLSDNGWFATHLTDLLHHCGKLKMLDNNNALTTVRLRESLILEYGTLLFEHPSLWAAGASYLCSEPGAGAHRAALLLERVRVRSEGKALALIAEANAYQLNGVVKTISSTMSARYLSQNRLGSALAWAVRARSPGLASRCADRCLQHYAASGRLPAPSLLLTVGASMLLCDRLVFLCKYCEFNRLYCNAEYKAAGKLLVALMTSDIIPDYFWPILFVDALPLLERDEPVIDRDATCDMMALLELRADNLPEERVSLLRLALVRNLAKAALCPEEKST